MNRIRIPLPNGATLSIVQSGSNETEVAVLNKNNEFVPVREWANESSGVFMREVARFTDGHDLVVLTKRAMQWAWLSTPAEQDAFVTDDAVVCPDCAVGGGVWVNARDAYPEGYTCADCGEAISVV